MAAMDQQATIDAALAALTCQYAFYYRPRGGAAILRKNCDDFLAASIIKAPLLYAWLALERSGEVSRAELCELAAEPPVQGSGLARLLRQPTLPYADVLLLMMALSDNLCTNLVIRRIGLARAGQVMREELGLQDTRLERKLFDYAARARGLENRVSSRDCIHLFTLRDALAPPERAWLEELLEANVDLGLFLRSVPRDTVRFYHKTGNIEGVLHDWGYTDRADMFLLTQGVRDEREVYRALDVLGPALLGA